MMAITLKPAEAHLREVLIGLAAEADPSDPSASALSYGDLAAAADADGSLGWRQGHPRYSKLITALFHVNSYEVEHGRPMIGAFAVSVDSRTSGSGFAALGRELGRAVGDGKDAERTFWRGELADAVAYWSDKSADGGLSDVQYDAIMAELAILRRSVRALAHGGPARRNEAERANAPGTPLTRHEQYNVFSYLVTARTGLQGEGPAPLCRCRVPSGRLPEHHSRRTGAGVGGTGERAHGWAHAGAGRRDLGPVSQAGYPGGPPRCG